MRGYGDDRGIAPVGVVQAVDEVDVPWAARPRAGREFFGKLGFGSGGEGGRFLMPHMDEPDAPVTAERVGNFAVVRFRNRGDTIPPEKLSRIFEQFYRLDTARSSTGGAGLGLAIARQITQLHGGSLTGESRDDTVTFTVTLPIEKSAVGKS